MATLVLTAVGTAIGGPIGGAIGAIIGQQVDQRIFAPKGREGPRLGDLAVQTSRYGSAIPKIFGKVRAAGTVIWSTDLIETHQSQSNGKGRPKTENYNYAASFAVVLSARPIVRIGRIWADGNLLRGAEGDFKTACRFRLLDGSEDQAADPLIAAAEGVTPAYRGCALAIFEDFQLADYGNRIPTLSFEIIADESALSIGSVVRALSAGSIRGDTAVSVEGVAIQGDSVRGVATALAAAVPLSLRDDGDVLRIVEGVGVPRAVDSNDLIDRGLKEDRRAVASLPEALSIAYNDSARDYQPGVQRARREGGSRREDRLDLAATLEAATAKAIAENRLTHLWRERRTAKVSVTWSAIDLRAGDRVTFVGHPTIWRVARTSFEKMALKLDLVPVGDATIAPGSADPGRNVAQADYPHGPTVIALLDLPPLGDSADSEAQLVVAANGQSPGWRRAALLASGDGGASFVDIGTTALPATMGTALAALANGDTWLIDRINFVDVMLVNEILLLNDADEDALSGGANLAMIGREALQFGRALPLGGGRWRLSELWRGRRGTEPEISLHVAGESFVLLEPVTLARVPAAFALADAQIMATGLGDDIAVMAAANGTGLAVRPLSPVGLRVDRVGGEVRLGWTRRSRIGWRWRDGIDVPLGEERERYRVTRMADGLPPLVSEVSEPRWTYPSGVLADDRQAGAREAIVTVAQIGAFGISPAAVTIDLI